MTKQTEQGALDIKLPVEFKDLYTDKYRYLIYYSGRSTGKTHAVAESQLVRGLDRRLRFLDAREFQSSIRDSVKSQLETIIDDHGWRELFDIQRDTITCRRTGSRWSFIGLKNNPMSVQSATGIDECWVEEAQVISKESLMALLPTIRKEGSRVVFTMNRLTDADPVFQFFTETPPPKTLVKYLDPYTLDRVGLQPETMKELRESQKGTPDYNYVWLGEPLSQIDNAIISRDLLVEAFERAGDDEGEWRVGVDVARFGADRTVIVAVKGLSARRCVVKEKMALTMQAYEVQRLVRNLAHDEGENIQSIRIKVDDTGVGGGLTDRLRELGLNVEAVNFAQNARQGDKYPTASSEMWFDFAEKLPQIGLKGIKRKEHELISELTQRTWEYDSKGRRKVQSKKNYKAESGNRSPDVADALLLAFYEPRTKKRIRWWQ